MNVSDGLIRGVSEEDLDIYIYIYIYIHIQICMHRCMYMYICREIYWAWRHWWPAKRQLLTSPVIRGYGRQPATSPNNILVCISIYIYACIIHTYIYIYIYAHTVYILDSDRSEPFVTVNLANKWSQRNSYARAYMMVQIRLPSMLLLLIAICNNSY